MHVSSKNVDPRELAKFNAVASRWWDPQGEFKPLHEINPLRLDFIDRHASLTGSNIVDVGCGGGILAESMALKGAQVTGIDMAQGPLDVAKLHLIESDLSIDYLQITAEDLASERPHAFEIVTCMELIEHVPDPGSLIKACATLVKPNGHVFFSTINRNPKAYLHAIIGAEYCLGLLPKGTHDYKRFVRPAELASWCRSNELKMNTIEGISYNPLTKKYNMSNNVDVNYITYCKNLCAS